MSETTTAAAHDAAATTRKNPLRQMLMRVGGTLTVVMAGAGLTPEEVVAKNPGLLTEQELLGIMTGSNPDVTVAALSTVAELFGATLMVGLNMQPPGGGTVAPAAGV